LRFFVLRSVSLFVCLASSATLFAQQQVPPAPGATDAPLQQLPAQQVQEAESLLAQSQWQAASAKLNAYLSTHPSDAQALFDAGYAADAQNHADDAAAFYRRAIAADSSLLEAHLSLGLLLARENKLEEARTELQAATNLNAGENGPAFRARAWRALAQVDRVSDPAAASNDLIEALKLTPETAADTLLAAELAESAGEWDAAEKAYRSLLAKDPKSPAASAGLAHVLIVKKNYPEAETLLRTALDSNPNDPALTAQLALVLAAQNKGEALPLLEKLHADHPADTAITRMLAEIRAEAGDTAGSDQLYTALLTASPHDAELLIGHGQNLIRLMRFAEAYQVFTKAAEAAPANPDAWSGLAFAASKTSHPSEAIHALTVRSQFLPESASTYFLWATSYDAMHDRAHAADYYHRFLDAAQGKFPDQEWQARQRLIALGKK
jgi:tetratricopeptide (TPR) repeat protein